MYRHVMGPGIGTYSVHHCRSYRVKITPRIHRNDAIDTWTVGNCHPKSAYIQYQGTANLIRTWVCTCKTLESRKGRDLKKSKADRTFVGNHWWFLRISVSADPRISWKQLKMQVIFCTLRESKGVCSLIGLKTYHCAFVGLTWLYNWQQNSWELRIIPMFDVECNSDHLVSNPEIAICEDDSFTLTSIHILGSWVQNTNGILVSETWISLIAWLKTHLFRVCPKYQVESEQKLLDSTGDVGTFACSLTERAGQAAGGQGANINETSDQCCNVLHSAYMWNMCAELPQNLIAYVGCKCFLRQQCSAHWFGLFLLLQAKQKQFITQLIVQGLLMLLEVPVTMILLPGISQSANLRDLWAGKTTRFGLHHLASLVRTA